METYVLALQAQFFRWTGLLCLGYGLYCGYDPLYIAWRAVLCALIALIVVGYLMRHVTRIMLEQASAEQTAQAKIAQAEAEAEAQAADTGRARPTSNANTKPRTSTGATR